MSNPSNEALLQRIKELENTNQQLKQENVSLKGEAAPAPAVIHLEHTFVITPPGRPSARAPAPPLTKNDYSSEIWLKEGIQFRIDVKERKSTSSTTGWISHLTLSLRNMEPTKTHKFLNATIQLKKDDYDLIEDRQFVKQLCASKTENFTLGDKELKGSKQLYDGKSNGQDDYIVLLTVAVQNIEPFQIDMDEATTIVVVHDKEIPVCAPYLSLWSKYFRAYFQVDMREKKEGRYPVTDPQISASDFEELLSVIHPTSKPITRHNFYPLLTMADRFEMPDLTRQIELYLIDFERNKLCLAKLFKLATDLYNLELVQATLLHRWKDSGLLQEELLRTETYDKLSERTKAMINQKFAEACIEQPGQWNAAKRNDSDDRARSGFTRGRGGGGFGGDRRGGFGGAFSAAQGAPPHRHERGGGFGARGGFGGAAGGFHNRRRSPVRRDPRDAGGFGDDGGFGARGGFGGGRDEDEW